LLGVRVKEKIGFGQFLTRSIHEAPLGTNLLYVLHCGIVVLHLTTKYLELLYIGGQNQMDGHQEQIQNE
jgi:hypothetical protein